MAIVCDASALVEVGLRSPAGRRVLGAIRNADAAAPDLVNREILSAFRRLVHRGQVGEDRAGQAIGLLATMAVRRVGTTALMPAIWDLRSNLSAYDATYVAVAQALSCPLVTADRRLAESPAVTVPVLLV